MRQRYAERTGQPDRTAEVASHGEGAVNSGMYSGVDSVEDYRVDSGMDAGWILGMIMSGKTCPKVEQVPVECFFFVCFFFVFFCFFFVFFGFF